MFKNLDIPLNFLGDSDYNDQRHNMKAMNEKKQTAVDWLVSQLNKPGFAEVITEEEIQQAKKMEKEMIMRFACYAYWDCDHEFPAHEFMEKYYNETFGQEDND